MSDDGEVPGWAQGLAPERFQHMRSTIHAALTQVGRAWAVDDAGLLQGPNGERANLAALAQALVAAPPEQVHDLTERWVKLLLDRAPFAGVQPDQLRVRLTNRALPAGALTRPLVGEVVAALVAHQPPAVVYVNANLLAQAGVSEAEAWRLASARDGAWRPLPDGPFGSLLTGEFVGDWLGPALGDVVPHDPRLGLIIGIVEAGAFVTLRLDELASLRALPELRSLCERYRAAASRPLPGYLWWRGEQLEPFGIEVEDGALTLVPGPGFVAMVNAVTAED